MGGNYWWQFGIDSCLCLSTLFLLFRRLQIVSLSWDALFCQILCQNLCICLVLLVIFFIPRDGEIHAFSTWFLVIIIKMIRSTNQYFSVCLKFQRTISFVFYTTYSGSCSHQFISWRGSNVHYITQWIY